MFQCTLTGLVFDISQQAELLYKTVQWDEKLLQQSNKMAAGPLFNIKSSKDAVRQLHLPHCVPKDGEQSTPHVGMLAPLQAAEIFLLTAIMITETLLMSELKRRLLVNVDLEREAFFPKLASLHWLRVKSRIQNHAPHIQGLE